MLALVLDFNEQSKRREDELIQKNRTKLEAEMGFLSGVASAVSADQAAALAAAIAPSAAGAGPTPAAHMPVDAIGALEGAAAAARGNPRLPDPLPVHSRCVAT